MKKFFKVSALVLGLLVLGAMFTSCSNVTPKSTTVAYVAEGSVSGGISASFVVANFQAAIDRAVGTGYVQENDAKVISACDNMYNSVKEDKTLDGTVRIVKKPSSGGSSSAIKTYTFKKSK